MELTILILLYILGIQMFICLFKVSDVKIYTPTQQRCVYVAALLWPTTTLIGLIVRIIKGDD